MSGRAAFVYGTLMAPEVVNALIKRVPPMRTAKIKGFNRYCVKGVIFPAIIQDSADAEVEGKVRVAGSTRPQCFSFSGYFPS
jgi:gamma-glutamylcyclotransferase (GGCT)/AIG2-like uncharacterized protein YtfP